MRPALLAAALFALAATPAISHRLDEYLQGTILSVGKGEVRAQMTLTPGVAVYRAVMAAIDTDSDGAISESEQRAYAARVLRDLTLAIDGHLLTPRLISAQFPPLDDLEEGRGEIRIEYAADLPANGPDRKLTLENRHLSGIGVYQVNCLASTDPDIRIVAQKRNYTQSFYELDYVQAGAASTAWWSGDRGWLAAIALLLSARCAWLWRKRARRVPAV